MSAMLQKAVDFAKHGEGITSEEYNSCLNDLKKENGEQCWPDFLGKKTRESYVSESVIGKIYRNIKTEDEYIHCLKQEHKYSIRHEYLLNPILAKLFLKNKDCVVCHLAAVWKRIVQPMT